MRDSQKLQLPKRAIAGKLTVGLFGTFLIFASVIAAIAALTILWPHGILVGIWSVKATEYQQLIQIRLLAGPGFALLSVVLALTAYGWFQNRRWAWFLAVLILAVNLLSDLTRMILTRHWADVVGAVIEVFILMWITFRPVRTRFFQTHRRQDDPLTSSRH